ncbi:MAG: UDP-N-acetylglucosamine 2-epimerase (non-hydrolyzing) [Nitrospirae bacterium]|nr:UDP-N-acetylglucosamine 2-epimerase (non-hydrolyzing) [Nitrospirota bacterium]
MIRVLFVFGTRPEAIKMAPVILELRKHPDIFKSCICVTAQHRRMLDQVLNLFEIKPDYDLDIMKPSQDLFDVTCNVLSDLKKVLEREQPHIILVQGDTTTAMAASLAGFYAKVKIGHIEAGLRTHNKFSPFPEEINRRVASVIADYHFAPTQIACDNLLREGVPRDTIYITGNTVIDSLLLTLKRIETDSSIKGQLEKTFDYLDPNKKLILVTGHRRESFGEGFENICLALSEIANTQKDVEIIYPVHLNPNVQEPVRNILGNSNFTNIHLIEPLDYLPFVYLMSRSYLIVTDSGGIQEEAPSLGKPVLVMRNITERPEAVNAGTAILVGTEKSKIFYAVNKLIHNINYYNAIAKAHNPYGHGKSAQLIFKQLKTISDNF